MENVDLIKKLTILRTQFEALLGEAHVLYGIIEKELKDIWHVASYKNKVAKPNKIEQKWKRVQKMTLGQIIEEVDYLSVCPDNNINILRNAVKPERNFLAHQIQDIFYDDRRLDKKQNLILITDNLTKAINRLKNWNKSIDFIAKDLNKRRLLLEKQS